MCKINDMIQDCVEWQARKLCNTNKAHLYDDLVSEGLIRVYYKGKANQTKEYYKKLARTAMLRFLKKEKLSGGVLHSYGGDRRSRTFVENIIKEPPHVISLELCESYLLDRPLSFGQKTSVESDNDEV